MLVIAMAFQELALLLSISCLQLNSLVCCFVLFQVNANGVISFRHQFSNFRTENFPFRGILIAPYWADVDLHINGRVFYQSTKDEQLLNEIGANIRNVYSGDFSPSLLFIATWSRVARFGGLSTVVSLSFCPQNRHDGVQLHA